MQENDNFEDELDQMNENLMNKAEILKLSEKELDAIQPMRMLYPHNPQASKNITYYSFKDRKIVKDEQIEHLQVHFNFQGLPKFIF